MNSRPTILDEAARLLELDGYGVLDTEPDKDIDELTALAAAICNVPVTAISLVDSHRQWFKSKIGLNVNETPREYSFCAHAMAQSDLFVVSDATQDPRFATNPLVTGDPYIRFYAGAPLVSPRSQPLGALCVIDRVPRELTTYQKTALRILSNQVVSHLELRRKNLEVERIKKEFQQNDERWRFALEGSEQGVWDWNMETNEIFFSEQWCKMLGYDPSEIGRTFTERLKRVHPDDFEPMWALACAHLEGHSPLYVSEHRMQAKDGTYLWVLDRGKITARAPDGRPLRFVGTHSDITPRKKADEISSRLRASERQFASAFEFASIGKAIVAIDGRWLKVNRALCQIVGYTAEELQARTSKDISYPDDFEPSMKLAKQILAGEIKTYQIEKRYVHKKGHVVWIHLSVSLVRDDFGNPLNFIAQIQDMTERRNIEEQYRQSQKMEAIGQLAGGIAHDFNNILSAIMMQADLATKDEALSKNTADMLFEINAAAQRAAKLTHQLLAFGRRQVMQQESLNLNHVVDNLGKMLGRVLGEQIRLELRLDAEPLWTRADAGMVDQVLMNLSVNARDAMPRGGHLTIETQAEVSPEILNAHVNLAPGRYVMLNVSDTGDGIPAEVLPHIFEPFFTTKGPAKGTGLGLATVFGIIKQHGGSISLKTKLGEGTTFQILLPADEAPPTTKNALITPTAQAGGKETVLVVEDDTSLRMLTCMMLERAGYKVLDAANGVDALQVWERHKKVIRLLVTDLVMPEGLGGRELAAKLQEINPDLRVIFTSGYSPDIAGKDFVPGRGQHFLPKPCPPGNLLQVVRRTLEAGSGATKPEGMP